MKFRKRYICFLLIICLGMGVVWQYVMVQIEKNKYSPIGSYVDVGTYQAHYYSKGSGNTVFVFITGSGTPCAYTDFYNLQNMLSSVGQTITFDHAGSGWSSKTNEERTMENLVNELSILINTVAPEKPIILICHSLGGLEAIGYAQQNPEKVKGIIFLDSGSPEFYSTDSEMFAKIINRCSSFIRITGLNRFLGEMGILLPLYGENSRNQTIAEQIRNLDKSMFYQFLGNPASLKSIELINENAQSIMQGPSLGDTPILILSSDSGREWDDVQAQLASWSKNSEQVMIEESKHYLYWSNYRQVSECIETFVKKISQ